MNDAVLNNEPVQPAVTPVPATPVETGNRQRLVILGLVIVAGLVVLLAFVYYNMGSGQIPVTPTPAVAVSVTPAYYKFTGNYLTAELPQGWTLVESLNSSPNTGLTSFTISSIISGVKRDLFGMSLAGVTAGTASNTIYLFQDTPSDFQSGVLNLKLKPTPVFINISNAGYKDITVLGLAGRFIPGRNIIVWEDSGNALYNDTNRNFIYVPFYGQAALAVKPPLLASLQTGSGKFTVNLAPDLTEKEAADLLMVLNSLAPK